MSASPSDWCSLKGLKIDMRSILHPSHHEGPFAQTLCIQFTSCHHRRPKPGARFLQQPACRLVSGKVGKEGSGEKVRPPFRYWKSLAAKDHDIKSMSREAVRELQPGRADEAAVANTERMEGWERRAGEEEEMEWYNQWWWQNWRQ